MVKITAVGHPHLRPCPAEQIEAIGCRLSKCPHKFGVPFNFYAMRKNWDAVCIEDLNTDTEEVLIVNDHFNLSSLMDESVFFDQWLLQGWMGRILFAQSTWVAEGASLG